MVAVRRPAPPAPPDNGVKIPKRKAPVQPRKRLIVVRENYWPRVNEFLDTHLPALRRTDETIRTYRKGLVEFASYLEREQIGLHLEAVTRHHIEAFLVYLMRDRNMAPNTAKTRLTPLASFFAWLVEEGELDVSPAARIKRPKVPKAPPQVLSDEAIAALLRTCNGRDFYSRRDTAMVRVLLDTGTRRGELCSITLDTLDLKAGTVKVTGKTGTRVLPLSSKTADAIHRYLRMREEIIHADLPALWLSARGALTPDGAYSIIKRRAQEAGIGDVWPHLFRHTFAHDWLAEGGQEGDLMHLAGWSSRDMIGRYGESAAHERAIAAARRMQRGNRV